jgi:hypothetical protein
MIDGRILIPLDVFTMLCVELAKTSDDLLVAARRIAAAETSGRQFDTPILDALMSSNSHITTMESILKAIMEENPSPRKPGSEGYSA